MTCYSMPYEWFMEIKDRVPHSIPYAYINDETGHEVLEVEVDVEEETFIKVSKTTKWMY